MVRAFVDLSEETIGEPSVDRLTHGNPLIEIGGFQVLLNEEQLKKLAQGLVRALAQDEGKREQAA